MTGKLMTAEWDSYLNYGGDGGINVGSVGDKTSGGLEGLCCHGDNGIVDLKGNVSGLV
jgi:hypothetical protein